MNFVSTSRAIAPSVHCRVIEAGDLSGAEACLTRHFPERSVEFWRVGLHRLASHEPPADFPRYGYCLVAGDEIVGVLLQMYSVRKLASGSQTLCHLSSWCVDANYRAMAPFLSIGATNRRDVTYINISPAVHTRRGIEALGFKCYSHGQMIFAPILSRRRPGAKVVSYAKDSAVARLLPEVEREILTHHVAFGCRAFVGLLDGAAYGFVTVKSKVLRGHLPCEQLIYCRAAEALVTFAAAIGTYLASQATVLCVVDANEPIDGLVGRFVGDREPKYFKGSTPPALGDLAYSELALLNNKPIGSDAYEKFWRRLVPTSGPDSIGAELGMSSQSSPSGDRRRAETVPHFASPSDPGDGVGDPLEFQRHQIAAHRVERLRAAPNMAAVSTEAVSAPAILMRRPRVRSLSACDLGQVAAIFRSVFRGQRDPGSASLSRDLETIFLGHPHYDESTSALVYERHDGEIGGFFGSLPFRANFMGSHQLGSIMSTWMVGDRFRDPRAGVMLVQSHLKRAHFFTLVDTANGASLGFAAPLQVSMLTAHSLQWIKPLNYCGYAMLALGERKGSRAAGALTRIARGSEALFRRLTGESASDGFDGWRSRIIDAQAFAERFLSLAQDYRLRPDWSPDFVQWLLTCCEGRPSLGRLRLCEVVDDKGVLVGCYAYHVTSEARAVVLQILTRRNSEIAVLRALIADAKSENCVVVVGSTSQRLLEALFQIPGVFYRNTCSTGVKVQQPGVLEAFLGGHALVGGLVGDGWMPLASEPYDRVR